MKKITLKKFIIVILMSAMMINPFSIAVNAKSAKASLSKNNIILKVGNTKKLSLKGIKDNIILKVGNTKKLSLKGIIVSKKFTSSDNRFATVTKEGKITALKEGTCRIYVNIRYKKKKNTNKIYKKRMTYAVKVNKKDETSVNVAPTDSLRSGNAINIAVSDPSKDGKADNSSPDGENISWTNAKIYKIDDDDRIWLIDDLGNVDTLLMTSKDTVIYRDNSVISKDDLKVNDSLKIGYSCILEVYPGIMLAQVVYCEDPSKDGKADNTSPDGENISWANAKIYKIDDDDRIWLIDDSGNADTLLMTSKDAVIYRDNSVISRDDLKVNDSLKIGYSCILEVYPGIMLAQVVYCE